MSKIFSPISKLIGLSMCVHAIAITPAIAKEYVVGISPFGKQTASKQLFLHVLELLMSEYVKGETVVRVFDAYNRVPIAELTSTEGDRDKSEKRIVRSNKVGFARLTRFLTKRRDSGLKNGDIRLPQFLEYVAGRARANSDNNLSLVLIGTPIHVDEREPGFSMSPAAVPSDCNLIAPRRDSVYSTQKIPKLPKGTTVHIVHPKLGRSGGILWKTQLHEQMVHRFWDLYMKQLGATLVTFGSHFKGALDAVKDGVNTNSLNHEVSAESGCKVEMERIAPRQTERVIETLLDENSYVSTEIPSSLIGRLTVLIRWDCDQCDVDLHAAPERNKRHLSFAYTSGPYGLFYKDFRNAPTQSDDGEPHWEYVEFTKDVDLRKVSIKINFYHGTAPAGIRGKVAFHFRGEKYLGDFEISAKKGNRAASGSRAHWTTVDPLSVVGISR